MTKRQRKNKDTSGEGRLPKDGLLRWKQLQRFVPVARVTIWRKVQTGEFPEPVRIFARAAGWRAQDVRRWLRERQARGSF